MKRFLLKHMPTENHVDVERISTAYFDDEYYRGTQSKEGLSYYVQDKKGKADSTQEEFTNKFNQTDRKCSKFKYLYKTEDGVEYFIEKYMFFDLIILNVEEVVPVEIESSIILEVTEHKEFLEENLANDYETN